jgi:hypothetical protein
MTRAVLGRRFAAYKTAPAPIRKKPEETTLATIASEARSNEAKARAEASFKKEERAKEGAKAMSEYQANSKIVRERMAQLKALRLAKEAADKAGGGK